MSKIKRTNERTHRKRLPVTSMLASRMLVKISYSLELISYTSPVPLPCSFISNSRLPLSGIFPRQEVALSQSIFARSLPLSPSGGHTKKTIFFFFSAAAALDPLFKRARFRWMALARAAMPPPPRRRQGRPLFLPCAISK